MATTNEQLSHALETVLWKARNGARTSTIK